MRIEDCRYGGYLHGKRGEEFTRGNSLDETSHGLSFPLYASVDHATVIGSARTGSEAYRRVSTRQQSREDGSGEFGKLVEEVGFAKTLVICRDGFAVLL